MCMYVSDKMTKMERKRKYLLHHINCTLNSKNLTFSCEKWIMNEYNKILLLILLMLEWDDHDAEKLRKSLAVYIYLRTSTISFIHKPSHLLIHKFYSFISLFHKSSLLPSKFKILNKNKNINAKTINK